MADAGAARRTPARPSTTALLRAATREAHLDAEAAVDLDAACADPAALAGLLGRLADGLDAVEAGVAGRAAHPDVPAALLAGWRRADALRTDARRLTGASVAARELDEPTWSAGEALGAWYVLEGARLGGPVIARTAARRVPGAREALSALAGPGGGPATAARWRAFAGWLDTREADEDEAVAGARAAFALVAAAVRAEDGLAVGA